MHAANTLYGLIASAAGGKDIFSLLCTWAEENLTLNMFWWLDACDVQNRR